MGRRPAPVGDLGANDAGEDRTRVGGRPASSVRGEPAQRDGRLPSAISAPMTRTRVASMRGDGRVPSPNSMLWPRLSSVSAGGTAAVEGRH